MANGVGLSFSPVERGDRDRRLARRTPQLADAIRVLSLRVPQFLGGSPLAPGRLMEARPGEPDMSIVAQAARAIIDQAALQSPTRGVDLSRMISGSPSFADALSPGAARSVTVDGGPVPAPPPPFRPPIRDPRVTPGVGAPAGLGDLDMGRPQRSFPEFKLETLFPGGGETLDQLVRDLLGF